MSAAVSEDRCGGCGYLPGSIGHRKHCVPVGSDGLTDAERAESARRWREGAGKTPPKDELRRVRRLVAPPVPRATVPHRVLCRHCLAGQLVRDGRIRDHTLQGERFQLCDGSGEEVRGG